MRCRIPWITLVIVVFVVFGPVIGHQFLDYDDAINITSNSAITNFSIEGLLGFWQKPYVNLYIPVTYSLWALLAKASSLLPNALADQPNPVLFHSVNLLFHLAAAGMVFAILHDLCRVPWAAWAGAVLFALHPVQVEAVAWATGMKDVLSGFFSLAALWGYLRYARAGAEEGGGARWWYYIAAAILFILAMLSKPGAVVTPALAFIIAVCNYPAAPHLAAIGPAHVDGLRIAGPLTAICGAAEQLRFRVKRHFPAVSWIVTAVFLLDRRLVARLVSLIPWLILAVPVVIVTRFAQAELHHVYEPVLWQRLLVVGDSFTFYLGKLIMPLVLGPDYGRTPQLVLSHGWRFLTGVFPYALAALIFLKGSRPWRAAAGIFMCALLPVSGIIPFTFQQISTVADRYLYLAMLGPALALAWGLAVVRSKAVWGGVILVLALFAVKSMFQIRYWHDPKVFYDHALKVNPRSWTAYNNLGNIFADSNQPSEAIAAYEKAIAIDPGYAEAYNNLGTTWASLTEWDQAINAFTRAMTINPYYVDAAINLGDAYRASAQSEKGIAVYEWVIASGFSSIKVYFSLCTLYHQLERNDDAASCYNKLLAIKPDSAEAYNNLGTVYKDLDRDDDAIDAYQRALSLRPEFAEVYNNLGFLYAADNKFDEAIVYYRKASDRYPEHTMPMRNLALAYIALGQSDQAITWLEKAIAADSSFAPAYNDLSRLYLAEKNFRQAVEYGMRARELGLIDVDHWQALAPYIGR